MSDQLPRLGGLSEPEKYERLVDRVPGVWWSDAGPFAGLHELNAVRVEYFRRVFGGFGGKRVLDVGCGGGILAETLAAEGATVAGIDPSEKSLAAAREHARRSGLTIDYRRGTAEDLGGAGLEGDFDLVFAVDVLEHVDDLERTIAGIACVLAPGGGLGFLTHNRTIAGFLQVVWDEEYVQHTMPEGFHDFARFITPADLSDALARHDMVVQEMKGVERAGDGTGRRVLTDDLIVTYLGWALRTRWPGRARSRPPPSVFSTASSSGGWWGTPASRRSCGRTSPLRSASGGPTAAPARSLKAQRSSPSRGSTTSPQPCGRRSRERGSVSLRSPQMTPASLPAPCRRRGSKCRGPVPRSSGAWRSGSSRGSAPTNGWSWMGCSPIRPRCPRTPARWASSRDTVPSTSKARSWSARCP